MKLQQGVLIRFITQLTSLFIAASISLIVVILCVVKLCKEVNDIERTIYVSLLSSILGIWIPSPTSIITFTSADDLIKSRKHKKKAEETPAIVINEEET